MSDGTQISWAEATWNVATGCTRVSDGCTNCYIERTPPFRMAHRRFDRDGIGATTGVQLHPERLTIPLHWRKPRKVFVCSLADLFHDDVPDEYIAHVFAVMQSCATHTFQVLTKRPQRMRALLSSGEFWSCVTDFGAIVMTTRPSRQQYWADHGQRHGFLPNVWLGCSAEDQRWADIRIPVLLDTPAAVRFVSAEPLLGAIDLSRFVRPARCGQCGQHWDDLACGPTHAVLAADRGLHWLITGGESGPGARPMHPRWVRGLRDQCVEAGVAFHFKQRGEWTWNEPGQFRLPTRPFTDRVAVMHGAGMTAMTKGNDFDPFERGHPHWMTRIERVGKKRAGRELDGRTWDEYPQAVVPV